MNAKRVSYKPLYILDASVMIKLIAQESGDTDEIETSIQKLTDDIQKEKIKTISLPLMCWEIGNWAARAFPEQALAIMSLLPNFEMEEQRLNLDISHRTFEIMRQYPRVTFYDASYHGLALYLGGEFLTNDKAYYDSAKSLGHIKLLKDY